MTVILILGRGVIGFSDKNEVCTLYDQNSTYNDMVYISPAPHLLSFINKLF